MTTVLLASQSPRRRELLERVGFDVVVRTADIDETPEPGEPAVEYARRLAAQKARAVAATLREPIDAAFGVAADTVVWLDADEPLGKPVDPGHARAMLARLAGRTHHVTTAFAIFRPGEHAERGVWHATASVVFRDAAADEIDAYVATGEPLDKAGSYAIQGRGGALIERVDGDHFTIVGLPLFDVLRVARELGLLVALPFGRPVLSSRSAQ